MRPEQIKLARWQGAITIISATITFEFANPFAAKSLTYGGAVAVIGTLSLAWRYRKTVRNGSLDAEWIARQAYKASVERYVFAALMLAVGFKILKLAPVWLLMGFVMGQLAWLAAPVWMRLRAENDK